jgi:predicted nucleic acid-binding protein
MNGNRVLADTNVFINLTEGKGNVEPFLENKIVFISVVSEIELLGWHKIYENEKIFFAALIEDCSIVELIKPIKDMTILLKQKHKIKLPNAIVAATAIFLGIPLLTFDTDFSKIEELDLILLEV